jgi:hypothetical protein
MFKLIIENAFLKSSSFATNDACAALDHTIVLGGESFSRGQKKTAVKPPFLSEFIFADETGQ